MLRDWEHPNAITWTRKRDTVVVASVAVGRDNSAFAVVTVNNQTYRKDHPNVTEAKAWCDQKLGVVADPPPPKQEAPKQEAPKQEALVERLLKVLAEDPRLAWEIVRRARVLGPWTRVQEHRYVRECAVGQHVASVIVITQQGQWSHSFDPSEEFATAEKAMANCDYFLLKEGWALTPQGIV